MPAILESAGMLERFYTDIAGNVGAGRALACGSFLPLIGKKLSRLANRRIPFNIRNKTGTFAIPLVCHGVRQLWTGSNGAINRSYGREFGEAIIRAGFGEATHVFTMLGEGGSPKCRSLRHFN